LHIHSDRLNIFVMSTTPKKTFIAYLATMGHNSTTPHNHGLVTINNSGFVLNKDGEQTPVEDYGMYIINQDLPFPENKDDLFKLFLDLIEESENES
jgi:exopolysaccharide biosynthesis protein